MTRSSARTRRRLLAAGCVLGLTVAGAAMPASAQAAAKPRSSTVTLAPGVTMTHRTFRFASGGHAYTERTVVLSVALSARTTLVAAAPSNLIGAKRATVLTMARQQHAVAGINGDFFYLSDPTAVPRGGLSRAGRTMKSALVGQQAALYVSTSGFAAIGDPGFRGYVTPDATHRYAIRSVNSLENARNGGLSLVDSTVLSRAMPHCAMATLTPSSESGRYVVRSVQTAVARYTRPAVGVRVLVSCAKATGTWMKANLVPGRVTAVSAGYAVPHIATLLSGGRVLVKTGKRYTDHAGLLGYGNQRKPETFACVQRGGKHVLLGVVEGDRPTSAGMTYAQLTGYLIGQHCWTAMTLDGSASSTLVAAAPHHGLAVQNRTTNKGGPRKVVDGLFVVRR